MGISEKILHPDLFHVHIYKEGVFWIAYEQSAYYFWLVKGYRPTKKFIKTVGKEIVSIGFPQNALNVDSHCIQERDEDHQKTFLLKESIDETAFEKWKTQLPVHNALQTNEKPVEKGPKEILSDGIIGKIRNFPIAGKTPLECVLFLSEIQYELTSDSNGDLR